LRTNQALAHKDGQGKAITKEVVTKEYANLPKDANGQVILGERVDTDSGLAKPRYAV